MLRVTISSFGTSLLASTIVACGGRISDGLPPPPDGGSLFAATDAGLVPPPLTPIATVPEGWVLEGYRYLDVTTHEIKPEDECFSDFGTKTFWSAPFRMMKFEVTNADYKACVNDGCAPPDGPSPSAWDGPENAQLPVIVSFALARAYCQHYGGDLPTTVQWDRAATGDPYTGFGVQKLTAQWLTCRFTGGGPLCDQLAQARTDVLHASSAAVGPVGARDWDIGPFGHFDLYGNAGEWVRTSQVEFSDTFCALPEGGPDPPTFSPEEQWRAFVRQLANMFDDPADVPTGRDDKGRPTFIPTAPNRNDPGWSTGFRCAFPP